MGLLSNFFKKKSVDDAKINSNESKLDNGIPEEWKTVPEYIETDSSEYLKVSLIASAIASGDYPESEFVVKKIYKRNPEAKIVSIIAASLATDYVSENSQIQIKGIYKK